jgi:hypothetical protein
VVAADREDATGGDAVHVSADDLDAALDDLLDTRNRMTRRALGLDVSALGEQVPVHPGSGAPGG